MAVGQALAVAAILAIGSRETGWPGYGAYLFALGFGAVLLWRERFPVAVLAAGVLGIFAYYIADYPPIGMAHPIRAALVMTSYASTAPDSPSRARK